MNNWPQEYQVRWLAAQRTGDFLNDPGAAAHLRPATKYSYECKLTYCIRFLESKQIPIPIDGLNEAAHGQVLAHWREALVEQISARSASDYLRGTWSMCCALWPDRDWRWLHRLGKIPSKNRPSNQKADRLRPSNELVGLGIALMEKASHPAIAVAPRNVAAVLYRDGLLIALLAARPMRLKNITEINLDRHLIEREGKHRLQFTSEDTKTHKPYDSDVPEFLQSNMSRYLEVYRPQLAKPTSSRNLWLSWRGTKLCRSSVYLIVTKHTKDKFGVSTNPHLFRDCAATSLVQAHPEEAMAASQLLGHSRVSTTDRHYLHGEMILAGRTFDAILENIASGNTD